MPKRNYLLDNTLPQSAYYYFIKPNYSSIEKQSPFYFETFIDSYINSDKSYALLPSFEPGTMDSFTKLWHENSQVQKSAALIKPDIKVTDKIIFNRFCESVKSDLNEWVGWLINQWEQDIVDNFTSRVTDWRDNFEYWTEYLISKLSSLSVLKSKLDVEINKIKLPHQYKDEIIRLGVPSSLYAIANALNFYKRGQIYKANVKNGDLLVMFHGLRDSIAVLPGNPTRSLKVVDDRLSWGKLLNFYLHNGFINRDEEDKFCEILKSLRYIIHNDKKFIDLLNDVVYSKKSRYTMDDVVVEALLKINILPEFRDSTFRSKFMKSFNKIIDSEVKSDKKSLLKKIMYETVRLTIDSKFIKKTEIKIRRKLNRQNFWKKFKIPKYK